MILQEAQNYVRQFARNAGESVYSADQIDRAIQAAGDEFVRRSRVIREVDPITLTANTSALPTLPTGFRPDRLIDAYLSGTNVQIDTNVYAIGTFGGPYAQGAVTGASESDERRRISLRLVPYQQVLSQQIVLPQTQQPTLMGFQTWATGQVWPTPDQNYTLNLLWLPFFSVWTPGDATQLNTVLNVPDEFLRPALTYGATAFLQHTDPQQQYANPSWKMFIEFCESCRGEGSLGVRSVFSRGR